MPGEVECRNCGEDYNVMYGGCPACGHGKENKMSNGVTEALRASQCLHGVGKGTCRDAKCPLHGIASGPPAPRQYHERRYLELLQDVASEDVSTLKAKDAEYGGSWKKRGGVGAFMMLARKWDRLEQLMSRSGYDIFAAAMNDTREEGVLDDIGDLRRYLNLVEAEIRARRGE